MHWDFIISVAGILVALYIAWSNNQIELPFYHKRQFLKAGQYMLFAPARETGERLVTWHVIIKKWPLTPARVQMWCIWRSNDDPPNRLSRVWRYRGRIIQSGNQIVFDVRGTRHLTSTLKIDGQQLEAATSANDIAHFLFHKRTIDFPLKPGVSSGFDVGSRCYGGLCILADDGAAVAPETASALMKGCAFLSFLELRERIETRGFRRPNNSESMQKS